MCASSSSSSSFQKSHLATESHEIRIALAGGGSPRKKATGKQGQMWPDLEIPFQGTTVKLCLSQGGCLAIPVSSSSFFSWLESEQKSAQGAQCRRVSPCKQGRSLSAIRSQGCRDSFSTQIMTAVSGQTSALLHLPRRAGKTFLTDFSNTCLSRPSSVGLGHSTLPGQTSWRGCFSWLRTFPRR